MKKAKQNISESIPFEPGVRNKIIYSIALHGVLFLLVLAAIIFKSVTVNVGQPDYISFICMWLLFFPMACIFLGGISFAEGRKPALSTRGDLNAVALSVVLPTVGSMYRNAHFFKKTVLIVVVFFPLLLLTNKLSVFPWIAMIFFFFMLLRYLRCLKQVKKCEIIISDTVITMPVMGFIKCYPLSVDFAGVTGIEPITSEKAFEEALRSVLEKDEMSSLFILGLRVYRAKGKPKQLILSGNVLPSEHLTLLYSHLRDSLKLSDEDVMIQYV